MKKVILLLVLLAILSVLSAEHSFGIKGGLNLASYRKTGIGEKYKFGAIGGIFYDIPLNQQFSIQAELLFTMKGQRMEFMQSIYDENGNNHGEFEYKSTVSISYLEIPILAKMELNRSERLVTNIYMGPFIGFNLDSSYKNEIDDMEQEGFENVNFIEMGFAPGVMLEFSNKLVFDARYTYGLTDIYEKSTNNNVISFMLGYKL